MTKLFCSRLFWWVFRDWQDSNWHTSDDHTTWSFSVLCFLSQELKNLIPKSAVGILSANSSNVINLIIDAYNVSIDWIGLVTGEDALLHTNFHP